MPPLTGGLGGQARQMGGFAAANSGLTPGNYRRFAASCFRGGKPPNKTKHKQILICTKSIFEPFKVIKIGHNFY